MVSTITIYTVEKFHNAEQLWFWFLYSRAVQSELTHVRGAPMRRPCELLDVETLVTKLYLCGRLTNEHLRVLKKFGDRRRAPNQYVWSENKDAATWNAAMDILDAAARANGWIE